MNCLRIVYEFEEEFAPQYQNVAYFILEDGIKCSYIPQPLIICVWLKEKSTVLKTFVFY